ncbi:MAG TPA: hypothetical protein VEW28_04415 [Candidatus Kapabacteria bacterium]|nr:hypothetical protein [Candidatus Kapabacteria bacterium]
MRSALVIILLLITSASGRAQTSGIDSCQHLQDQFRAIAQGNSYQEMYDSGQYNIEHCANANIVPEIWFDFGTVTTGCQYKSDDPNRWPPYREWLKKVLYLNKDTNYYCEDVQGILACFQHFNDQFGYDDNGALAVIKFLLDSHRCLSFVYMENLGQLWTNTRNLQYQHWKDTVRDQQATPFSQDTILPSLEDRNLQVLRGPQYQAVKDAFTPSNDKKILYLAASENPFTSETTLKFGLSDAEYIKIEIYDLLGNKLYSENKLSGEGANEWKLDGRALPHGSMYARLSTMGADVMTIKLVRE